MPARGRADTVHWVVGIVLSQSVNWREPTEEASEHNPSFLVSFRSHVGEGKSGLVSNNYPSAYSPMVSRGSSFMNSNTVVVCY